MIRIRFEAFDMRGQNSRKQPSRFTNFNDLVFCDVRKLS